MLRALAEERRGLEEEEDRLAEATAEFERRLKAAQTAHRLQSDSLARDQEQLQEVQRQVQEELRELGTEKEALCQKKAAIFEREKAAATRAEELAGREKAVADSQAVLESRQKELEEKDRQLQSQVGDLAVRERQMEEREKAATRAEQALAKAQAARKEVAKKAEEEAERTAAAKYGEAMQAMTQRLATAEKLSEDLQQRLAAAGIQGLAGEAAWAGVGDPVRDEMARALDRLAKDVFNDIKAELVRLGLEVLATAFLLADHVGDFLHLLRFVPGELKKLPGKIRRTLEAEGRQLAEAVAEFTLVGLHKRNPDVNFSEVVYGLDEEKEEASREAVRALAQEVAELFKRG